MQVKATYPCQPRQVQAPKPGMTLGKSFADSALIPSSVTWGFEWDESSALWVSCPLLLLQQGHYFTSPSRHLQVLEGPTLSGRADSCVGWLEVAWMDLVGWYGHTLISKSSAPVIWKNLCDEVGKTLESDNPGVQILSSCVSTLGKLLTCLEP